MTNHISLGEICEFTYGDALKEENRHPGKVPVYGSNGMVGWHNQALTRGKTIIIGRKGSVGEINWSDLPCFPIDTTYFVDSTKQRCELKWLYYALLQLDLTRLNKAAAVPGLNREDAYEQRVVFPSVREQQRIARLLEQADHLRGMRRYALQMSDEVLPAAFLELFGDPRPSKTNWPTDLLGVLGTLDRGRSQHRPRNAPHLYGGPYPFVQTGDVANARRRVLAHRQTYSEEGLKQSRLWPTGTLCITIAANIADTAVLTYPACFPDSVVGFTRGNRVTVEYIQFWFHFLQTTIQHNAPEVAQKNINLDILSNLRCPVPPMTIQNRFAKLVDRQDKLRATRVEALRQADHLFQNLLHQAFTA